MPTPQLRGVLEDVSVREVNDLIQSGDKRLTVAAADVAAMPSTADRVLIGGITHQVIRVTTIEQDNTAYHPRVDLEGIMARVIRLGQVGHIRRAPRWRSCCVPQCWKLSCVT
jgi:hypothetical protein